MKTNNFITKLSALICTVLLFVTSLGTSVFATEGEYSLVSDEAGVLTEETKSYIQTNLRETSFPYDGTVKFATVKADEAPKNGVDGGFVKRSPNSDNYTFVWVDGANVLKLYGESKTPITDSKIKLLEKEIAEHSESIDDKQTIIKDAFGIYAAGLCYPNRTPESMTVGAVSAEEYVAKLMKRYETRRNIFGAILVVIVIAVIIFFFAKRKTPEGTVPGDGSMYKKGYGSGVAGLHGGGGVSSKITR